MNPIYPSYGAYNYGYNPMMYQQQQQRLAEYEQQYPQLAQQGNPAQPQVNNTMPMGNNMGNNMGNSNNYVKCRAVTSIDEAKASMIDLDGSIHVFTDIGNKCIYTKQINLDGTATLNTYVLQEAVPKETTAERSAMPDSPAYVKQEELESVCRSFNKQLDELEDRLEEYERAFARQEELLQKATAKGGKK